jgi:hypothetical protein
MAHIPKKQNYHYQFNKQDIKTMKTITAKKIIGNMSDNKTVKLRKNRVGGISDKTWDSIADIMLGYGYKSIEYYPIANGYLEIILSDQSILSSKVILY